MCIYHKRLRKHNFNECFDAQNKIIYTFFGQKKNGRVGHVRSIEGTLADLSPVRSPETVVRSAMPSLDGDLGLRNRYFHYCSVGNPSLIESSNANVKYVSGNNIGMLIHTYRGGSTGRIIDGSPVPVCRVHRIVIGL